MNEFLIFRGTLEVKNKIERKFYLADVNVNGSLTFDEFVSASNGKAPLVTIRRNFLRADVDESATLSLDEFLNFRRGLTPKGPFFSIYALADINANDEVTVAEFSTWFRQGASEARIALKFDRFDTNNDGVLVRAEWNPGIKD